MKYDIIIVQVVPRWIAIRLCYTVNVRILSINRTIISKNINVDEADIRDFVGHAQLLFQTHKETPHLLFDEVFKIEIFCIVRVKIELGCSKDISSE